MELLDINRIDTLLRYEFENLLIPETRIMRDEQLIYYVLLKPGSASSLGLLVARFEELGYNVRIAGHDPRVTLAFTRRIEQPVTPEKAERGYRVQYRVHVALFFLTFLSTLWAGALQFNVDVFKEPLQIWKGLPFAVPLMMILLAHEMGHYLMSQKYQIRSTLPYFIPFPNIIGTMGAVIKMKSPIPDRKALIDVGMAGPLAGVCVAIPTLILGLRLSTITPTAASPELTGGGIILGESLLFKILSWLVHGPLPHDAQIMIHPVAFAGWIGLLVTFMNLFPASQLDGGHISYALFRSQHKTIGKITFLAFIIMGIFYWPWFIWMVFIFFIGLGHPPPINDVEPVDRGRVILGIACMLLFVLTCTPRPFYGEDLPTSLFSLIKLFRG